MDEILASLNNDTPVFDNPSMLFDLDSGLMPSFDTPPPTPPASALLQTGHAQEQGHEHEQMPAHQAKSVSAHAFVDYLAAPASPEPEAEPSPQTASAQQRPEPAPQKAATVSARDSPAGTPPSQRQFQSPHQQIQSRNQSEVQNPVAQNQSQAQAPAQSQPMTPVNPSPSPRPSPAQSNMNPININMPSPATHFSPSAASPLDHPPLLQPSFSPSPTSVPSYPSLLPRGSPSTVPQQTSSESQQHPPPPLQHNFSSPAGMSGPGDVCMDQVPQPRELRSEHISSQQRQQQIRNQQEGHIFHPHQHQQHQQQQTQHHHNQFLSSSQQQPLQPDIDIDAIISGPPTKSNSSAPALATEPPKPPSKVELARRALREPATKVVATAWRNTASPAAFVASAREELSADRISSIIGDGEPEAVTAKAQPKPRKRQRKHPLQWQLGPAAEGALLDALLARITAGEAASTRLLNYVRHALVSGLVTQRAVLDACVTPRPNIADRVAHALARLLADMLPHFSFTTDDSLLAIEADQFLAAFTLILTCGAASPAFLPVVATLLSSDRVVAIVRASARRNANCWVPINTALARIEASSPNLIAQPLAPVSASGPETLAAQDGRALDLASGPPFPTPQSGFISAYDLRTGIHRLRTGLGSGITSIQAIAARTIPGSPDKAGLVEPGSQVHLALHGACNVAASVFGSDVAKALRALWIQREQRGSDVIVLNVIELHAFTHSSSGPANRYSFRDRIRACEAIVRYLVECSSVPGAVDQWLQAWGGTERLLRLLRDALPQVKLALRSEFSSLIVATAVIGSAAMCLGPALRIQDANDGSVELNSEAAAQQVQMFEQVEDLISELSGFAVGCLEEAAVAEETPLWRSLGVWLLLLASRCGCMLRASNCEHTRAANVLRAWSGSPSTIASALNAPASSIATASAHPASSPQHLQHRQAPSGSAGVSRTVGHSDSRGLQAPPQQQQFLHHKQQQMLHRQQQQMQQQPAHQHSNPQQGHQSQQLHQSQTHLHQKLQQHQQHQQHEQHQNQHHHQHQHQHQQAHQAHPATVAPSSGTSNTMEGVACIAASAALAILDASDMYGDNATLRALCGELMD
jgi:hypothetical protein